MLKRVNLGQCIVTSSAFLLIALPSAVIAAQSDNLSEAVHQCVKITNDQQRLACFDRLVQPAIKPSVETISEVTAVATVTATAVAKSDKAQTQDNAQTEVQIQKKQDIDEFAQEHLVKTPEMLAKEVNSIELVISELTKLIRGEWKITFDNGQKWRQKGNTRIKLKVGDNVIIEKGALGVFYLKKVATKKRIQVKRLK